MHLAVRAGRERRRRRNSVSRANQRLGHTTGKRQELLRGAGGEIEACGPAQRRKNQRRAVPRSATLAGRLRRTQENRHHHDCEFAWKSRTGGGRAAAGGIAGYAFRRYPGARLVRAQQRASGAVSEALQRRSPAESLRALLPRRRPLWSDGGRVSHSPAKLDRGPGGGGNAFLRFPQPFVPGDAILRAKVSGEVLLGSGLCAVAPGSRRSTLIPN